MKSIVTVFILLLMPFLGSTQISDNFSDGNFTENPIWIGNDSLFCINSEYQLQLDADSSGSAYLSVLYNKFEEMEWQFWIREKFSPSTNNYCDVYLYSEKSELKASNDAYFLRFGEAGSDDVIELFRLENGEMTSICRGTDDFIASSFSTFIKVTYDKSMTWKIFTDKEDNGNYKLEASAFDNNFKNTEEKAHFGFICNYSNSNIKNFYFDDIYIGEKIVDSIAPSLISLEVSDDYHIKLKFDENISEEVVSSTDNFIIEPQNIKPEKIYFGDNNANIILEFATEIEQETELELIITDIEDLEGNIRENIRHAFLHYKVKQYDIVINEIMADPSPAIGLEEWEYIELYNRSEFPIDIRNRKLQTGNKILNIEDESIIEPKNYFILCHEDAVSYFSEFGKCYGFSSFQIGNSRDAITIFDKNDEIISSVNFDISWHSDSYKEEGGWSLEQVDSEMPCAGKDNWGSSCSGAGGTPGSLNSINDINIITPELSHVTPISNRIIEVHFKQNMDIVDLMKTDNFTIKELDIHPTEAYVSPEKSNTVELIFDYIFEDERLYILHIGNIHNCVGIETEEIIVSFGMPMQAEVSDIIINEVLFNPISPGVDYVELYNNSEKVIDLSKIMIGTIKEQFPNPADTVVKEICSESRILLPQCYILLSSDGEIVKQQYNSESKDFLDMETFPAFASEEGEVIICDKNRKIIDKMRYTESMHYDLLYETKGVALERISFECASSDENNWHSASYSVNYGTPGYKNSMAAVLSESDETAIIEITPEIFSPDGDGYNDICSISYNLDKEGYSMNIKIFNSKGILVRNLLKNNLVGKEGVIFWDGCDDNKHRVETGIYIVQVEFFNLRGEVGRKRKVVVVANK